MSELRPIFGVAGFKYIVSPFFRLILVISVFSLVFFLTVYYYTSYVKSCNVCWPGCVLRLRSRTSAWYVVMFRSLWCRACICLGQRTSADTGYAVCPESAKNCWTWNNNVLDHTRRNIDAETTPSDIRYEKEAMTHRTPSPHVVLRYHDEVNACVPTVDKIALILRTLTII